MQVPNYVNKNFFGRLKPKRMRVTDIQLHDPVTLFLEALGLNQYRTANVV